MAARGSTLPASVGVSALPQNRQRSRLAVLLSLSRAAAQQYTMRHKKITPCGTPPPRHTRFNVLLHICQRKPVCPLAGARSPKADAPRIRKKPPKVRRPFPVMGSAFLLGRNSTKCYGAISCILIQSITMCTQLAIRNEGENSKPTIVCSTLRRGITGGRHSECGRTRGKFEGRVNRER